MRQLATTSLIVALLALTVAGGCNSAVPPMAPDAMLIEPQMPLPPTGMTPPPPGGAPPPAPPPPRAGVVAQWVGVGYGARGSVRITAADSVVQLDFSDDFAVDGVPGPFVYINTTNNANTGRPLRISALRRNRGAQSYAFRLPAGATFAWVLIWCDPYNVPVAEARVPAAP